MPSSISLQAGARAPAAHPAPPTATTSSRCTSAARPGIRFPAATLAAAAAAAVAAAAMPSAAAAMPSAAAAVGGRRPRPAAATAAVTAAVAAAAVAAVAAPSRRASRGGRLPAGLVSCAVVRACVCRRVVLCVPAGSPKCEVVALYLFMNLLDITTHQRVNRVHARPTGGRASPTAASRPQRSRS